jgi:hypothetical protein
MNERAAVRFSLRAVAVHFAETAQGNGEPNP